MAARIRALGSEQKILGASAACISGLDRRNGAPCCLSHRFKLHWKDNLGHADAFTVR